MKSEDFRRREFVGLEVEVLDSTCASLVGLRGRVVGETRNTIMVEVGGVEKVVPKDCCDFLFQEGSRAHKVSGNEIKFRPEDRIKKVR
jgi:ribonuclease P protein subunit POP4